MPYIRQSQRARAQDTPENPGELNYAITTLIRDYIKFTGLNYSAINDVLGALEGTKTEFYRRGAAPYEDQKIKENGDVY